MLLLRILEKYIETSKNYDPRIRDKSSLGYSIFLFTAPSVFEEFKNVSFSRSPVLLFPPVLPFSRSPVLPFSRSPVLPFLRSPVLRSSFSFTCSPFLVLLSSFSVPFFPFLVLHSSFSVPRTPFLLLCFPFSVPRSPFLALRSLL